MSEPLTQQQLATMRMGASPEMDVALDEIVRLEILLQEWQRVGDAIMAAIGKTGPLSDSEVIGELNRLRAERDEARDRLEGDSWIV